MDLLWTAFALGLVGSLHCAVMCGPLILAVTNITRGTASSTSSRVVYHAGRVTIYMAIGVLFGAIGRTAALVGLQRWISLFAGIAILAGLLLSSRFALKIPFMKLVTKLKTAFTGMLRQRGFRAQFLMGAINGLLPCGLVYVAAAGAATTLSPSLGVLHMAAFGAGTLPMLLGVSALGSKLRIINVHAQKLIPASVALLALLLVLRSLGLGIPYLSPNLTTGMSCH
jgi:uncharacterized protein